MNGGATLLGMRHVLSHAAVIRLFSHIDGTGDCWEWRLSTTKDGYGKVRADGTMHRVHRLVYQLLVRKLRATELLDHQCKNRRCCNPDHMDVTDNATNTKRGWKGNKVHCISGHRLTPETTYIQPSTGSRRCTICERERRLARAQLERIAS